MKSLGGVFHAKAIGILWGFRIAFRFLGFNFGPKLQDDIEMIAAGWIGGKHGAGFLMPAGVTKLVVDLADGVVFGGGTSFGGFNLFGGGGMFAGSSGGSYAGD